MNSLEVRARAARRRRVRILGALICLAALATALAEAASVGVVKDPCADVPARPTAAHKASSDWYGNWMRDWLALDFGQRCRYAAENRLLGPGLQARVVFLGDSITEGWKDADPTMFSADVLDRGISGQTTEQMLVRFRADVLELRPAVVHIMAGTNDVAGNHGPTSVATIEGNIRSLVEQASANGITVVLASLPPASRFGWSPVDNAIDVIAELNGWLRAYARTEHLMYVDYYGVLGDGHGRLRPEYSEDGVHPNRAGYEAMRPLALDALHTALESRDRARRFRRGAGGKPHD